MATRTSRGLRIADSLMETSMLHCNIATNAIALGVTSEKRVPQVRHVPAMVELGYEDFVVYAGYGMCAPAGTPQAVLEKLHAGTTCVMNAADVQQRLNDLVINVATQTRDEFTAFMRAEATRWARVVKDAGIPAQ